MNVWVDTLWSIVGRLNYHNKWLQCVSSQNAHCTAVITDEHVTCHHVSFFCEH